MRKNCLTKILILFVLILLFTISGCKKGKKQQTRGTYEEKEVSNLESGQRLTILLDGIALSDITFDTFSSRGKVQVQLDRQNFSAASTIRIKKDQIIWASFSVFGIEAARVFITPDSVKVLTKMGRDAYRAESFDYIRQMIGYDVDFSTLQSILIGNAVQNLLTSAQFLRFDAGKPVIKGSLDNETSFEAVYNQEYRPVHIELHRQEQEGRLKIYYDDYLPYDEVLLPKELNIHFDGLGRSGRVVLSYQKVALNEQLEFPFSIPKSLP